MAHCHARRVQLCWRPLIPVVTLAVIGDDTRSMFDGRYVIDEFSLIMKAMFLIAGYVVILLSTNEIEEGGYYQGEYYVLLLSSVLGMVMMTSSRDLISVFVALEFLSIPAYMLAAWRKRDPKSNEAGVKYFLLGVFASAILLYGMSLLYGVANSTLLVDIGASITVDGPVQAVHALAVVFVVVGFAFKVSAVPFHSWAPDTYQGAPTPVTAFLSVASKAGGFVALVIDGLSHVPARPGRLAAIHLRASRTDHVCWQLLGVEANQHRAHACVFVDQPGWIHSDAVGRCRYQGSGDLAEDGRRRICWCTPQPTSACSPLSSPSVARPAAVRSPASADLFGYAPGLGCVDDVFPRRSGRYSAIRWMVRQAQRLSGGARSGTGLGYAIAIIGAVNTVIAFGYYGNIMREMWMKPAPDGDVAPIHTPPALVAALGITAAGTLVLGILPGLVLRFGDLARSHRCHRPLTTFARPLLSRSGAIPFVTFMESGALWTATGSTRRGAVLDDVATSSPAQKSVRCSGP